MKLPAQACPPHTAAEPGDAAAPVALLRQATRELALAGAGVVLAAAAVAGLAGFGWAYGAIALLWFAAGAWLVRLALSRGTHPHARFGGANRVTLLRLALAGLLVGLLGEAAWAPLLSHPDRATLAWGVVGLATLTAVLDAVDGLLARRSGLASRFGARFDMETDAAFTLVLCALVWQGGQAGAWVLAAGLLRYAFVAAAWLWPWLAAPLQPSRRRQTVCVLQITSLIVCLGPVVPQAGASALAAFSLGLLCLSFAIDIRRLARTRPALATGL